MRKVPQRLEPAQRIEIIRRAAARNSDGKWTENYGTIADAFGVALPCVSRIARAAGIAPRSGGRPHLNRPHRPRSVALTARIKASKLYCELVKKVGRAEALRIVHEHVKLRGLAALADAA